MNLTYTYKKNLFLSFLGFFFALVANAQILPPIPDEVKTNSAYTRDKAEMIAVYAWSLENRMVKFYSKADFQAFNRDEQAELEGYGHIIVYEGIYPTLAQIEAYQAQRAQIVSRTFGEYKTYLYENDPQRFKELFE